MFIFQGAEAIIKKENKTILKERIPKSYRLPSLDLALRKFRTKREAKIMAKLPVPGPKLIRQDESTIIMTEVPGKLLKTVLDTQPLLAKEVGKQLAKLHDKDIIHGDLTTSNLFYDQKTKTLSFIDFGLSYQSKKIEDKAVDIHLFKQALESKHHAIFQKAYTAFLKGYTSKDAQTIFDRLAIVESRGRYKERA